MHTKQKKIQIKYIKMGSKEIVVLNEDLKGIQNRIVLHCVIISQIFIYSSALRNLGCSCFGTIMTKSPINIQLCCMFFEWNNHCF